MVKQYTIPIFVPHLGCPFDCVFCNQRRITGKSTTMDIKQAKDIIDEYLSYFDKDVRLEVGFFGGSFTGIETKIQEELLNLAFEYKQAGKIDGIRLSTRPDFINEDILDRLKKYTVDIIELGVQSLTQDVLDASGRGHKVEDIYNSANMIRHYGIGLGLQMMVGLPNDTFEKSKNTVEKFIDLKPECVRIYPTLVIKDTALENQYLKGVYRPLDITTSIDFVSDYLMMFELNNINVIRVGLQPTDNMQLGKDIVAGPFHPSYGQLIESNIYKKILEESLKNIETKNKDLIVEANNKYISSIVGQKGSNKHFLKDKLHFKNIEFRQNNNYIDKNFSLEINGVKKDINYKDNLRNYLINRE